MKAVILAGGLGTRLLPHTFVLPKPLVPVCDRPILDIIIRQLGYYGFSEAVLTLGYLAELIEAYVGTISHTLPGISLSFVKEERPLGTAGPIGQMRGADDTFLLINGDILTSLNYSSMVEFHRRHKSALTIGTHTLRHRIDVGVVELDPAGRLISYTEKPERRYSISMGVYVCEPSVLGYVQPGEAMDIPQLVLQLISDSHKVMGYRHDGHWLDIGNPQEYARACELFEKDRVAFLPWESAGGDCKGAGGGRLLHVSAEAS
ncbi:MAG TPA: sugar phosphate nucleotidyltransferase [Pyrinomonadaceae bacterium]